MGTPFDIAQSMERARERLSVLPENKQRSDCGTLRLSEETLAVVYEVLSGQEHPGIRTLLEELQAACDSRGLGCPSRMTLYKVMRQGLPREYAIEALPPAARAALYNLCAVGMVPGPQLAFYCFNYGDLAAIHFAAGLPWWPLYQAYRMRGWRRKSKGLLRAVMLSRGIPNG